VKGRLGGDDEDPGAPTNYLEDVDGEPTGRRYRRSGSAHHQRKKCRRRALWDPGAPTINAKKHRRSARWEAMPEIWECPSSTRKTSMVGPLGGGDGDPGTPTINAKNIDSGPPRRRCRRSKSAHHQRKKCRWRPPPPVGGAGGPGVPTINAKNVDGKTPRRRCQRSESTHH
jgi:hypothetical protein